MGDIINENKEVIVEVLVQDVEVGLKRSATLPLIIMDKVLMVLGELGIGLRPAPLPPIIQVFLVDHWFLIAMVVKEMEIVLIPDNFPNINMVDYTFPTRYFSGRYSNGCARIKYTSEPSLSFLSKHATTPSCNHSTT